MLKVTPLESFVPIHVQGADARTFMQGQLSYDVRKLTAGRAVWGGHCTGQGRVILVMTLIEREEGIVALCDSSSANELLASLRARIFSSKVSFELLPLVVAPISAADVPSLVNKPLHTPGECVGAGQITVLRWWGAESRYLLIAPPAQVHALPDEGGRQALAWRESDVREGLPRIFSETERAFVPQMLNLDLLAGIGYDKGCYTGQEVVARARRGGVPRRMFRFSTGCVPPRPGTAVVHQETEVGLLSMRSHRPRAASSWPWWISRRSPRCCASAASRAPTSRSAPCRTTFRGNGAERATANDIALRRAVMVHKSQRIQSLANGAADAYPLSQNFYDLAIWSVQRTSSDAPSIPAGLATSIRSSSVGARSVDLASSRRRRPGSPSPK